MAITLIDICASKLFIHVLIDNITLYVNSHLIQETKKCYLHHVAPHLGQNQRFSNNGREYSLQCYVSQIIHP